MRGWLAVSLASVVLAGCIDSASPPGYDRGMADGCNSGSVAAANPYMGFRSPDDGGGDAYRRGYSMGYDNCREQFNTRGR